MKLVLFTSLWTPIYFDEMDDAYDVYEEDPFRRALGVIIEEKKHCILATYGGTDKPPQGYRARIVDPFFAESFGFETIDGALRTAKIMGTSQVDFQIWSYGIEYLNGIIEPGHYVTIPIY